MMSNSKDYLSQEEIEALLKNQEEEQPEEEVVEPLDINAYLTVDERDTIGEVNNISYGAASTTLSALLGHKVEITTPKISVIKRSTLGKEFPQPHVAISVQYVQGLSGVNLFVLTANDAKIIADLMQGGSGVSDGTFDMTELQLSAVQEAMNQMMGSSATAMSKMFNKSVNISTPNIDMIDLANNKGEQLIPQDDVLVKVAFELKIGDLVHSKLLQLITVPFVKNMVTTLKESMLSGTQASTSSNQPAEVQQVLNQVDASAPYSQATNYMNQMNQFNAPNPFNQPPPQAPQRNVNVNAQTPEWASFNTGSQLNPFEANNLNMLMHIPLKLSVELGRTQKLIKDILDLSQGSIVELDKLAGEPVDILVNDQLIAKGEVVVIDENFGVRVTEIITQWDRIQKLR
jgi:flagellar motor switch protein FliN/FliY